MTSCQALEGVIAEGGFYIYVAGTMLVTCSRFGLLCSDSERSTSGTQVSGLTVDNYLTTLPLKKGLSSSAAVCVLVVKALCHVYGLELTIPQVRNAHECPTLPLVYSDGFVVLGSPREWILYSICVTSFVPYLKMLSWHCCRRSDSLDSNPRYDFHDS